MYICCVDHKVYLSDASSPDSTAGVDYNLSSIPLLLALPAGSSSLATPITILADSIVELDEMVAFQLDTPPGAPPGYSIDPMLGSALVTIVDNNCERHQTISPTSNIHMYLRMSTCKVIFIIFIINRSCHCGI